MWVYVSENFDVHAIMRKMWESVSESSCPNYQNLDVLISQVADKLRGKRYLLVLDDVWSNSGVNDQQQLNKLFAPLQAGIRGSKILVTTRNEQAARALGTTDLINLLELADEAFLKLFMSHALSGQQVNEHLEKRLCEIGENIVKKLSRLPLAAVIVAGQLRRRLDPEFWASMLTKSLLTDTMGALFLSYQHLPPPLQRCFAFCSLFPKGHEFEHDHLVNLWIAEGFIETDNSNEHMKDIGNRYILELISSSFFQVIQEWGRKVYSMHDLIHDLAQNISEGEYFRIESGEKKEIPVHILHIWVAGDMLWEYVDKVCKLKNLRTIISFGFDILTGLKEGDLDALFKKLRKLYVVDIEGESLGDVKRVSKSVVQLRNLRYLNLESSNLDAHYVSLCYQLRFLEFEIYENPFPNVGRLISLQELGWFRVRMERGFELKQLEHLKDLYGSLFISGLNNVKSKEEADQAKLSDKKGLRELLFKWDYGSGDVLRDNDAEILDGLYPPPQIKELTIKRYSGKRFPSWISENNDNVIHLQHLQLSGCDGLEALHRINELSDLLSLTIYYLTRLKSWVPLPLNLTQLKISNCLCLVFAVKEDLDMIMSTKGTRISRIVTFKEMMNDYPQYVLSVDYHFESVQEMMRYGDLHMEEETLSTISKDLNKCLEKMLDIICRLKDVYGEPFLPPALETLSIEFCFITDKILAGSLQGLTSLTYLTLRDIITITCIPKEVLSSLTNLLDLEIHNCLLITSIGGLDTHSTLERLEIYFCPNLATFETSSSPGRRSRSSTLKFANLQGCMLSDDILQGLISLENLWVQDIPTMVNPHIGHFKTLSFLEFHNCPNLASLRGLNELTNLERFSMSYGCDKLECYSYDKLPQLKELIIYRFSLLEQLVSREGLSSLVSLNLIGAQEEYFSQEECDMFRYLSSLTKISFRSCKMCSLPNLMCLHSLIHLNIMGCENLTSLSDVPPSVQHITIYSCDEEFMRSCEDSNHPNWHKISHIPDKGIREY